MTRSALVAYLARRTAPGPRNGLVGNLVDVAQGRMFELLSHMWRAHGDTSCARVGLKLVYLVVHPDQIQHVLVTRRENYTKELHRARPLIGDGLPASNGELWARQRRLLTPRFQPAAMPRFAPPLRGAMERMLARWRDAAHAGATLELGEEMTALTLDAILGSLCGEGLDDGDGRLRAAIRESVAFVAASGQLFRVPLSWPTARNQRFTRALAVIDDFVHAAMTAHRGRDEGETDLLAFLLRAIGEAESPEAAQRLVRDEAVSLLLGGHESTAQGLTWLLYLLGEHAEARARVLAEVDEFGAALPTVADRARFPFLTAAAQEALRLYPPFWAFPPPHGGRRRAGRIFRPGRQHGDGEPVPHAPPSGPVGRAGPVPAGALPRREPAAAGELPAVRLRAAHVHRQPHGDGGDRAGDRGDPAALRARAGRARADRGGVLDDPAPARGPARDAARAGGSRRQRARELIEDVVAIDARPAATSGEIK
jgi:cytochrome P450